MTKKARRPSHYLNYGLRLITKTAFFPVSLLPDNMLKNAARRTILKFQNSLPLELALDKGDVGVQIGTPWPRTMRRLRKAVGADGAIVIVEAEPKNFERLGKARDAAGWDNVHVVNYAGWSRDESGVLTLSPAFDGDHKIDVDGVTIDNDLRPENQEMLTVPCEFRRIDTVLAELGIETIDYLSVTVNGAELEVLKGAQETLARSPDVRVFSKGHSLTDDGTPINRPIRDFLAGLRFETMLTRGEPASAKDAARRDGDVYAWKAVSDAS